MKNILFLLVLTLSTSAFAKEVLVLSLQTKVDENVASQVDFYACDMDPNVVSQCDYRAVINKKSIHLPEILGVRLDWLRRSFSYDAQSGQIENTKDNITCKMGGPAKGFILNALYLTYDDQFVSITSSEMKPVFSYGSNCLFAESITPKNQNAREDARAVMEILNTLQEIK